MLILTRRIGEKVIIGNDSKIEFTVLDINRRQVKIGINAPKDISVHRNEIYEKINEQEKTTKK